MIKDSRPGKGYVVPSMFRKVEADYYVFVDGDDTFSAEYIRQLLEPVMEDHARHGCWCSIGRIQK